MLKHDLCMVKNNQQNIVSIGCPKKNVPASHKNVPLVQKRALYLDTAQRDKQLWGTFLWDTGTFFWDIRYLLANIRTMSDLPVPLDKLRSQIQNVNIARFNRVLGQKHLLDLLKTESISMDVCARMKCFLGCFFYFAL